MILGTEHKCERTHDCIHCGMKVGKGYTEIRAVGRGYHPLCFGEILASDMEEYMENMT